MAGASDFPATSAVKASKPSPRTSSSKRASSSCPQVFTDRIWDSHPQIVSASATAAPTWRKVSPPCAVISANKLPEIHCGHSDVLGRSVNFSQSATFSNQDSLAVSDRILFDSSTGYFRPASILHSLYFLWVKLLHGS